MCIENVAVFIKGGRGQEEVIHRIPSLQIVHLFSILLGDIKNITKRQTRSDVYARALIHFS